MSQLSAPFDREHPRLDGMASAVVGRIRDSLPSRLEAAAFWLAVVLPVLHVPLVLSGIETGTEILMFAGLIVLNGVAIVVGHSHHRE